MYTHGAIVPVCGFHGERDRLTSAQICDIVILPAFFDKMEQTFTVGRGNRAPMVHLFSFKAKRVPIGYRQSVRSLRSLSAIGLLAVKCQSSVGICGSYRAYDGYKQNPLSITVNR